MFFSHRDCVHWFAKKKKSTHSAVTSTEDVAFLSFGIILLVVGTPGLRIITGVMVLWHLGEEAVQFKTQGMKYLSNKENTLDLIMLSLILPLLLLPDV